MRDLIKHLGYKNQVDENTIAKLFEDGYLLQKREDKLTTKKTFSPSSIGYGHGTCPRYWALAFNGVVFKDNTDPLGFATMASGTAAHTRLEKLLEAQGCLIASEIEITVDDPPIRGFLDAKIEVNGETLIGEFKTTRQESFAFKQTTKKPSPNHLLQLLIYLHATEVQRGFLLYENRNVPEIVVIMVEMNDKNKAILEECFDWLRTVRKAWEDKLLPIAPFQQRNKICQACPVYDACWSLPTGDIKLPKMVVPTL